VKLQKKEKYPLFSLTIDHLLLYEKLQHTKKNMKHQLINLIIDYYKEMAENVKRHKHEPMHLPFIMDMRYQSKKGVFRNS
jgi:hypothetical protein